MIFDFNSFILRTPYYSTRILERINTCSASEFEKAMDFFLRDPVFREAIYYSSPGFLIQMDRFLAGEISEPKKKLKFKYTFLKYLSRMATRCTPFGIFAGCSMGEAGSQTKIVPAENHFSRKIRFDMSFLAAIADYVQLNPVTRRHLFYYPNNTIYRIAGGCRYVDFTSNDKGIRSYHLSGFQPNDYLEKILSVAGKGALFTDIASSIIDDEIALSDADYYIDQLIQSRVLISELEPKVTGQDYVRDLLLILKRLRGVITDTDTIAIIAGHILFMEESLVFFETIDTLDDTIRLSRLIEITEQANALVLAYPARNVFQVDSFVKYDFSEIDSGVLADIKQAIPVYLKFCSGEESSHLERFKTDFNDKFEGRTIPLSHALDPEQGIAYASDPALLDFSPLIDDLYLPRQTAGKSKSTIQWNSQVHTLLLQKILAGGMDSTGIILTDDDLKHLPDGQEACPPSFNILAKIHPGKNNKNLIEIGAFALSSATCHLTRFCHLNPVIGNIVQKIADHEKQYFHNEIVGEINHLSNSRLANILIRPEIRDHELCYLTRSNDISDRNIPLNQLFVSIKNNEIVLSIDPEGKTRVRPRLSNAHNFHNDTLPVYRFVGDLQKEKSDQLHLKFDTGPLLQLTRFIPRITYKQFIFYPATWSLVQSDFASIITMSIEEACRELPVFFEQKKIPGRFYIPDRDNHLYIDIDNISLLELFFDEIKTRKVITIVECVFNDKDEGLVFNQNGNYRHELIIPFGKSIPETAGRKTQVSNTLPVEMPRRKFQLGSEWCYAKIYTGIKNAEIVIRDSIYDVVEQLERSGVIVKWFFIRYSDPMNHVRLRFHLLNPADYGLIVDSLVNTLQSSIEDGRVSKIDFDTYVRELERYGFEKIEAAEAIFHADSKFIFSIIKKMDDLTGNTWKIGILIVDLYVDVFCRDDEERYRFIKMMKESFANEFGADKNQRKILTDKYRNLKPELTRLFQEKPFADRYPWFEECFTNFRDEICKIRKRDYENESQAINPYLASFIHMSLDRLFRSRNRLHEYVLYSLLEQEHRMRVWSNKNSKPEA
jgi:thiopeptide-type bacteriocin biosynthesis protein